MVKKAGGRMGSAGPPGCGEGEEGLRGSLATAPAAAPQSMTLKHPPASCVPHPRRTVLTLTPRPPIVGAATTHPPSFVMLVEEGTDRVVLVVGER